MEILVTQDRVGLEHTAVRGLREICDKQQQQQQQLKKKRNKHLTKKKTFSPSSVVLFEHANEIPRRRKTVLISYTFSNYYTKYPHLIR